MSALLVDIGNTRIKWRHQPASGDIKQGSLEKSHAPLFSWPNDVDVVVVSSVRDDEELTRLFEQCYPNKVNWLTSPILDFDGFHHCYSDATRLGVDRWLAMLGARKHQAGDLIVVDAGTALTVDVLSANNHHQGGYIVPGLNMARDALFNGTGKVRPFADETDDANITLGKNTRHCVNAGTLRQHHALVSSVCSEFPEYTLLVTGGDGQALAGLLNTGYYSDLIFDGMDSLCAGLFTV